MTRAEGSKSNQHVEPFRPSPEPAAIIACAQDRKGVTKRFTVIASKEA